MPSAQYQLPQQPPPNQPTGQLLNTQPAPQMPADKNVASLAMPTNTAMTNLGFANNMLHHLIQYKASKGKPTSKDASQTQELQENPKEEAKETPQQEKQEDLQGKTPDNKINEVEANFTKQIADLKKEMKDEISGISAAVKEAIANEKN